MLTSSCRNVSPLAASTWIGSDRQRLLLQRPRPQTREEQHVFWPPACFEYEVIDSLVAQMFFTFFFPFFSFFKLPIAFQCSEPSFFFLSTRSVTAAPEPSAARGGSGAANMLSPLGSSLASTGFGGGVGQMRDWSELVVPPEADRCVTCVVPAEELVAALFAVKAHKCGY